MFSKIHKEVQSTYFDLEGKGWYEMLIMNKMNIFVQHLQLEVGQLDKMFIMSFSS